LGHLQVIVKEVAQQLGAVDSICSVSRSTLTGLIGDDAIAAAGAVKGENSRKMGNKNEQTQQEILHSSFILQGKGPRTATSLHYCLPRVMGRWVIQTQHGGYLQRMKRTRIFLSPAIQEINR